MSITQSPELTVLMNVFNAEKYLNLAIESILEQTYTDFEFIIINDGSKDSSEAIIQKYAQLDPRIIFLSRENKGIVASANEGIALSSTKYIARMDADDIALPNRLEEEMNFLKENEDVVCVGSGSIIIDDEGYELTVWSIPTKDYDIQKLLMAGHCPLANPSVIFRKDAAIKVGCYREEFGTAEDYDLFLRLGEVGKLANINKPLIKYRFLSGSVSGKNQIQQRETMRLACSEAWKRRGIKSVFTAGEYWRPINTRNSKHKFSLEFGWWAYNYKNKPAAIKYGIKSIKLKPWDINGWKLFIISSLKL